MLLGTVLYFPIDLTKNLIIRSNKVKFMRCKNCGKKNPYNAKFCSNCGSKLEDVSSFDDDRTEINADPVKDIKTIDAEYAEDNSRINADPFGSEGVQDRDSPFDNNNSRIKVDPFDEDKGASNGPFADNKTRSRTDSFEGRNIRKFSKRKILVAGLVFIVFLIIVGSVLNSGNDSDSSYYSSYGTSDIDYDKVYKVGTDLPAGEYYIKCNSYNLYVEIASDNSDELESIIGNLNTNGGVYVTVYDGEYLKIDGGKLYELQNKPAVSDEGGYLTEGQYKVGTDIPAGVYIVEATDEYGYYEITSDGRHDILNIISNDYFKNSKTVTLSNGQYIELENAKLKL